jgi:hypothetical protein
MLVHNVRTGADAALATSVICLRTTSVICLRRARRLPLVIY